MDQYDYKTINIPKGSEEEFHRVFQSFGYRPIISQEVTLPRAMDGKIQGKADMAHFYNPKEADEALLGLSLHLNDAPVDNYVRLTYGRNRMSSDFKNYSKAEHLYNRMTYDCYLLYGKAKKAKKKRNLPGIFIALFLILLLGGIACTVLGYFKGGYETALHDVFKANVWGMLYWFGMAAAILGAFCFLLFGTLRRALQSAKYGRYKNAMLNLEEMKSDFRNAFRHSQEVPPLDEDKLELIEKVNKLQ